MIPQLVRRRAVAIKIATIRRILGDKVAFDFLGNGQIEYAEITNDGIIPPTQSGSQFILFSAQSWELKND